MLKGFWYVAFVVPALLVLAACGSDSSPAAVTLQAAGGGQPIGISVNGEGRASGTPDVAVLILGVSTRGATVQAANAQAQEAANKLLATLRANGVAEKDIQTQQFSISPEYGRGRSPEDEPKITGYRVSNMVQVKVRRIAEVGKVIDAAVSAVGDALQVQGVGLTIDDPKPLQEQAREKAMADAKAKAEQLAKAAGVGLGRPLAISEGGGALPIFERGVPVPLAKGGDTPISPGELEVVVAVQVTYAIQ